MRGAGPASRRLARLDAEVARAVLGGAPVVLAFSGGLGSLVVGALARKRCDVRCVVVGFRGSADLGAAEVARDFLDYRLTVLRPTAAAAFHTARRIAGAASHLTPAEVLDLVPVVLVRDRHPSATLLSGFGLTARTSALRNHLTRLAFPCPGLHRTPVARTRAPLIALAEALGVPESFVRAAPHPPREGSGVGPALRAFARSRRTSLPRLLAASAASRNPRSGGL